MPHKKPTFAFHNPSPHGNKIHFRHSALQRGAFQGGGGQKVAVDRYGGHQRPARQDGQCHRAVSGASRAVAQTRASA